MTLMIISIEWLLIAHFLKLTAKIIHIHYSKSSANQIFNFSSMEIVKHME